MLEILFDHYGNEKKIGDVSSESMVNAEACRAEWSITKKSDAAAISKR